MVAVCNNTNDINKLFSPSNNFLGQGYEWQRFLVGSRVSCCRRQGAITRQPFVPRSRVSFFFFFSCYRCRGNWTAQITLYYIHMSIKGGKFRCLISLRCAVIPIFFRLTFSFFFFFVCPRPVAVAPGHVGINLFYITDRERQRGKYIRIEKRKKGRQYIHDQVVRHVWISGTCTRILSSFSALPVLCCSDYSFAVCRRHARINSTPLFHLAHFSLLIHIRQGSEKEKIGDLVHVWSKEVFPSSSLFPLSLLLVFAHIFASPLALPNVLTLGWPTTGNKKN